MELRKLKAKHACIISCSTERGYKNRKTSYIINKAQGYNTPPPKSLSRDSYYPAFMKKKQKDNCINSKRISPLNVHMFKTNLAVSGHMNCCLGVQSILTSPQGSDCLQLGVEVQPSFAVEVVPSVSSN